VTALRPRRPGQQDIVAACRRHFKSPLSLFLALDVGKVPCPDGRRGRRKGALRGPEPFQLPAALQVLYHFAEVVYGKNFEILNESSFAAVSGGNDQPLASGIPCRQGHRQCTIGSTDGAVQSQLANVKTIGGPAGVNGPRGGENSDGQRQIERRALLSEIGGRKIYRDSA